jgi:hypothetical protein
VQLLKPNAVHVSLPKRALNDNEKLQAWLLEVEQLLPAKPQSGAGGALTPRGGQ